MVWALESTIKKNLKWFVLQFLTEDHAALYVATASLGNDVTITRNDLMLYARPITADGTAYTIYLSGGYRGVRTYADLKTAVVLTANGAGRAAKGIHPPAIG